MVPRENEDWKRFVDVLYKLYYTIRQRTTS